MKICFFFICWDSHDSQREASIGLGRLNKLDEMIDVQWDVCGNYAEKYGEMGDM